MRAIGWAKPATAPAAADPSSAPENLPLGLIDLKDRAERLFERIAHLDRRLYLDAPAAAGANAVRSQFDRLREAFSAA